MHNVSKKQSVGRGRSGHPQPVYKVHGGGRCIRHLLFPHSAGHLLADIRRNTPVYYRGSGRRGHHFLSRVQMEKTS